MSVGCIEEANWELSSLRTANIDTGSNYLQFLP
jgi:hypothetical protein